MILDERNEFGDAATLVGDAASTYILGDVIDLGVARDISQGEPLFLVVKIDTLVAAAAGAANITFKLVSDSTADLATSPTVHLTSGALAKGTLVAGYTVFAVALPRGTYERYLGVTYTPDTNNITAGKADAFLTTDVSKWTAYDSPNHL